MNDIPNQEIDIQFIPFQELSVEYTILVLKWRNSPDISKWMFNTQVISWKDHLKFIESLSDATDKKYWLVFEKNKPMGVVNLTNINDKLNSGTVGIFKNPDMHWDSSFIPYFRAFIYYCKTIGFKKLTAETIKENRAAQKFFLKSGFIKIKEGNIVKFRKMI